MRRGTGMETGGVISDTETGGVISGTLLTWKVRRSVLAMLA